MTQPSFIRYPLPPEKPPRNDSRLVQLISSVYSFDDANVEVLKQQLTEHLTRTYLQTIQSQLNLYGCPHTAASSPDAESQAWIASRAQRDAQSIARTYNAQMVNEVRRLYDRNPKGNRNFYIKNLDLWATKRSKHKVPSISLNTMVAARDYATRRFRVENGIEGRYVFVGPPPVCARCLYLKSLGPVSAEEALAYGDSQHIGCPHRWSQLLIKKIDCATAWRG